MKREVKRLVLARETLMALEEQSLPHVVGGAISNKTNCTVCPSCPHITCQSYTC